MMHAELNLADTQAARDARQERAPRRHIVHGVLSLELGGLERLVLDLVRIGAQRGHMMSVICIENRGRLAEMAEHYGADVYCIDKAPGRSQAAIQTCTALLKELAPDVVHTHQIGALWYLGSAARIAGAIPTVHTEHSDHVRQSQGVWRKLRSKARLMESAKLASRFCCVSEDIAASVRHLSLLSNKHLKVVRNGIDVSAFADCAGRAQVRRQWNIPENARVLGTVGRLNEVKRQDLLLRAMARLAENRPNLWLLIVGDGPEREPLERLAAELGILDRTRFTGYQADPQRFFAAFDVFALTSRHEGLPLALLEAWAAGLAVVAPAVGGIPAVVEDRRTALLFPPGDLPLLVDRLVDVVDDPQFAKALGTRARATVAARHSLDAMIDSYEMVYGEAIA